MVTIPKFLSKIEERKTDVCVVGLGQVGLPTALIFADAGFNVTGYDINEKVVHLLNQGQCHFSEPGLKKLLRECITKKRFRATLDFTQALKFSDVVIICVPTPLSSDNRPNLDFLEKACKTLVKKSLKDKLIVIESSIPPGTTRKLLFPILKKNKHELGKDFWVVYIPERLAPGNAIEEIGKTARIIGSHDPVGAEIARSLYKNVIKNEILVTDVDVAETSKLVENTYRDVNIAFANEVAQVCEELKIDVMEVIRVANTHPRVQVHRPGVGVGGPCIPKDPYLLISPYDGLKVNLKVIPEAREVNESMPKYFVRKTELALSSLYKTLKKSSLVCLGVAYKGNVSDTRNTPAEDVIRYFVKAGAAVYVYDPYSDETFGGKRSKNIFEHLKSADAIIFLTEHDEFKNINLAEIKKHTKPDVILVDGRRIINPQKAKELKLHYVAVGLGQ